jgi:hypothetical protein
MNDTIMKMRGGCQGKKKPLKIRKLVLQRICKKMQICHYFVMRGEIDGQLVKIAGLDEIHGEWMATPVSMEVISICLII